MVLVLVTTACAVVGLAVLHVRRIRVPEGLAEPLKYRILIALTVIPRTFEHMYSMYHRGCNMARIRARRFISENLEPKPLEIIEGSNIRSNVTYFNETKVRLYEPIERRKEGLQPGMIYMHGGGTVLGSTASYDGLTRLLAERLDMVVVSVEYRLAPEHPFPAGFNDNLNATKWFIQNAHTFGVDPHRVVICGDSAGGCFAAGVSQVLREDNSVPDPKLQVMIYPALQQLDFHSHSYQKYEADFGSCGPLDRMKIGELIGLYLHGKVDPIVAHRAVKNEHISEYHVDNVHALKYVDRQRIPADMRLHEKHVELHQEMGTRRGCEKLWGNVEEFFLDPRFAPLVQRNLSDLPRAMITTCGFDCLRDDGYFYAERLKEAGVPVHYKNYESGFHGIIYPTKNIQFEVGKEMLNDIVTFINDHI